VSAVDTTPLVVLSNRGPAYIGDALESLEAHTPVSWAPDVHIVDDSGDPTWRAALIARHGDKCTVHAVDDKPAGYTAAMRRVWEVGRELGSRVFLLEEDFVFVEDFDVRWLHDVLDTNQRLAQVALLREPWYPVEKKTLGGVMDAQQARVDGERAKVGRGPTTWVWHDHPHVYRTHDAGFTGNPSLITPSVFDVDWPYGKWTETAMGDRLIARDYRFGWFPKPGTRTGSMTRHIGAERANTSKGY
jgi:hypothetical protein